MPWIPRGLREGIVTSRYPRRSDGYGQAFRTAVTVRRAPSDAHRAGVVAAAAACPTGAISTGAISTGATPPDGSTPHLDRGRCILCGRCVALCPEVFAFDSGFETAAIDRRMLIVPHEPESEAALSRMRSELLQRVASLRRSVHVRHVDAGSDGADEWEVAALTNPVYDVQRLGIFFTASPRHADILLVTGAGSAGMLDSLRETYHVMPHPKVVIAAGVDAISGGIVGRTYATAGGIGDAVPVDVWLPGAPPTPFGLLYALLLAVGRVPPVTVRAGQ
jgi:Ni,Fe-hydrogenase III small subunit/ferredoxin